MKTEKKLVLIYKRINGVVSYQSTGEMNSFGRQGLVVVKSLPKGEMK